MTEAKIAALEAWAGAMDATAGDSILDHLEAWRDAMILFDANQPPAPPPTGKLPLHRFGVHLIQSREGDLKYIEALKPAAVKILDPDPNVVRRVLAALDPAGVCILRDHPLSEQHNDMKMDPTGTGRRHAADWIAKLTTGRFKEFGSDKRIVVCGINEPDVHNQAEEQIVFLYTKAFLEGLTAGGIRGLALNLSVGWPRNSGPDTPPVWDTFMPLETIILRGNHFLCVHEYWYPALDDKWGWYGNRISKCKMSVPIIIGECGYTRQLANLPQPWGWIGNIPASTYAADLWKYHDTVDPNVFAILPFTSGFASQDWASKDILPAAADILARKHNYAWPAVWPVQKGDPTPEPEDEVLTIIWPKMDKITGWYGSIYNGNYAHEGLDISRATGTPVYAPFAGVVAFAGVDASYGNYCRIFHPRLKICTFFAHLSELRVTRDNGVIQGQLLGYTGSTGNSSGPHLHFEVRKMTEDGAYQQNWSAHTNARVDPLGFLAGWLSSGNLVEYR